MSIRIKLLEELEQTVRQEWRSRCDCNQSPELRADICEYHEAVRKVGDILDKLKEN